MVSQNTSGKNKLSKEQKSKSRWRENWKVIPPLIGGLLIVSIDIALLSCKAAEVSGIGIAQTITEVIIGLIIVLVVIGVLQITGFLQKILKTDKTSNFVAQIPSYMTAIGMIGTFSGILIGLMNFDTNNLDASVPLLLEGMKTAFATSVSGLISSVGLRITNTVAISIGIKSGPTTIINPTPTTNSLEKLTRTIQRGNSYQSELNNRLEEIVKTGLMTSVSLEGRVASKEDIEKLTVEIRGLAEAIKLIYQPKYKLSS